MRLYKNTWHVFWHINCKYFVTQARPNQTLLHPVILLWWDKNIIVQTQLKDGPQIYCRSFLAHPSWRQLSGWACSFARLWHPLLSSSTLSNKYNFKTKTSWPILVHLLELGGGGEGQALEWCWEEVGWSLHSVLRRSDQNSGFHGNRKPPLV